MHHFDWIAADFLPAVAAEARAGRRRRRLRIWSAACSTGEEPYSIALKVLGQKSLLAGWDVAILGTDISGAALAAARAGSYDARSVGLVPPEEKRRYFDEDPGPRRWTLKPEARALVAWEQHNLLKPAGGGPFDCIFLKNVLIYFDADSKQAGVRNLVAALAPGGYLVVGPTEGVFKMLDPLVKVKTWLYRKPA
jgi:chemotaxis protein methyltransferase CheR